MVIEIMEVHGRYGPGISNHTIFANVVAITIKVSAGFVILRRQPKLTTHPAQYFQTFLTSLIFGSLSV